MRSRSRCSRALENAWRLQLRRQVRDPRPARASCVPDYPIGCKRILFSNDWYPALDRDHVEVVTEAVTGVEPGGVRAADGTLHEADVLIWGTGFAATDFLGGIEVTGARRRRPRTSCGRTARTPTSASPSPGFPNLFSVYGPNTNLGGSSIIGMLEAQAGWIAQVVRRIADGPVRAFEVRPEVAEALRPGDAGAARRQRLGVVRQLVHATAAGSRRTGRARSRSTSPACARSTGRSSRPA